MTRQEKYRELVRRLYRAVKGMRGTQAACVALQFGFWCKRTGLVN